MNGFEDPAWIVWAVNAVLAVLLAEIAWLMSRRPRPWQRLLAAASGLALLLAWRASLAGAPLALVGLCLALAGMSHIGEWIADRRRGPAPPG